MSTVIAVITNCSKVFHLAFLAGKELLLSLLHAKLLKFNAAERPWLGAQQWWFPDWKRVQNLVAINSSIDKMSRYYQGAYTASLGLGIIDQYLLQNLVPMNHFQKCQSATFYTCY